ncbi:MAG: Nramp family divalent metal transporter [Planctomycetota bacterium]
MPPNASEIAARKPLPPVPGVTKLLGPGLVWMALAQGSGELIWWPYLVAKYGLAFLFLLIPACFLQLPLTFEIGRYTLLTGEGIFRGFFRLSRTFGVLLWLLFTVSFFWFGAFASAGGTAIATLTDFPGGWSPRGQTLFWAQSSIVLFTLALVSARRVYVLIEAVMKVVAVTSLVGMTVACCHPTVRAVLGEFVAGLIWPDWERMQTFDVEADASRLLTAISFAGLGGFWALFYSYWLREKGAGMAGHGTHHAAGRGGAEPIRGGDAALPEATAESAERLRGWYRYLTLESLVGVVGNLATTLMSCLLAYALLTPTGRLPEGFEIAVVQSEFFAVTWGDFGRGLFLVIAATFLADTWLATADCVARIHLDALGQMFPVIRTHDSRRWYYGLVLAGAVITSVTMYLDQPGALIVTSALIGFAGTVIYAVALILVNHRLLNRQLCGGLRSTRWSLGLVAISTAIYAALAVGYLMVK